MANHQRRSTQEEHRAHGLIGDGGPHPHRMRTKEIELKLLDLIEWNLHVREKSEACIDAIKSLSGGNFLLQKTSSGLDPTSRRWREDHLATPECHFSHIFYRQWELTQLERGLWGATTSRTFHG
jgi:hypothetical protein